MSRSHDIAKRRHNLGRKGSWGGKGTGRAASWILGGHLHVELCHGGSGKGGGTTTGGARAARNERGRTEVGRGHARIGKGDARGRDGGPGQPVLVVPQRRCERVGEGCCSFLSRWSVLAWPDGNHQPEAGRGRGPDRLGDLMPVSIHPLVGRRRWRDLLN